MISLCITKGNCSPLCQKRKALVALCAKNESMYVPELCFLVRLCQGRLSKSCVDLLVTVQAKVNAGHFSNQCGVVASLARLSNCEDTLINNEYNNNDDDV